MITITVHVPDDIIWVLDRNGKFLAYMVADNGDLLETEVPEAHAICNDQPGRC